MRILKKVRSVRFVLAFWYSGLLLVALILFGGGVYLYLEHLLKARLDQNLREEIDWIAQIVDLERSRIIGIGSLEALSTDIEDRITKHFSANPRNLIVVVTTTTGTLLYESDERGDMIRASMTAETGEFVLRTVSTPGLGSLRVAGRYLRPFVILVADNEEATRSVLDNLVSIFSVLAPVVLFGACVSGWLMAGFILRPVRLISERATRITAQRLNERIPPREEEDELGTLITTINGMIARLQASFDEMKQFSMNVAHELKTPLTIMKGESELALSRPLSTAEVHELITTYLQETGRMSRIVDDLLTLAKAEAGQITLQKEVVHLDVIIRELYEDALILAEPRGLSVELVTVQPAALRGDAARLRQLFRILVTNAVQYTDPGGVIRISCETRGESIVASVEDTGIGIPAESIPRIFVRFYRVDQARTRRKGGSGLGLSLAHWIVESHGGTIAVKSEPGKGSTFTVEFPLLSTAS